MKYDNLKASGGIYFKFGEQVKRVGLESGINFAVNICILKPDFEVRAWAKVVSLKRLR